MRTLAAAGVEVSRRSRQLMLWAMVLNWGLAVFAAILPLDRLWEAHRSNEWWRYQAAEWLINLSAGPVRRGLSGQVLINIPGVPARTTVTILVGVLAVLVPLLFAMLIAVVMRRCQQLWPMLLWGVPGGVLLGLRQGQWIDLPESVLLFATRKEQMFLALLLGLSLLLLRGRWPIKSLALGYGLVLLPMAFVHEGLTFVFAVAGAWIAVTAAAGGALSSIWHKGHLAVAARVLVPAALGVLATIPVASPDRRQLEGMWRAVDPGTRQWLGDQIPGPFELMSYDLTEALKYAGDIVVNPRGIALWGMLAVFAWGWTWAALWLTDTSGAGIRYTSMTLALMVVAVLPLLPVAIDWGRFIVIAALTTAVAVLTRQAVRATSTQPAEFGLRTAIVVTVMLVSLVFVGVPEAGAPFGEP